MKFKKLKKIPNKSWISGTCAGLAYSLGVPTWLVRLIFLLSSTAGVCFVYLCLWLVLDIQDLPDDYEERCS